MLLGGEGYGSEWCSLSRDVYARQLAEVCTLNYDQLNSVLVEVEAIVNSRPLTYVYDNLEGVSYAISPSHLLYG